MNLHPDILEGEKLLKGLIERDRKNNKHLKNPELFYKHSKGASNVSYFVSCAFNYQGINVDVELTQVAGLLHDIGKIVATPQEYENDSDLILDSAYGAMYLEKMGLPEIAETIRPSFTSYELIKLKPGLYPNIELSDFIPKEDEQKIVVYSDIHTAGNGSYVSFNGRMADIRKRYGDSLLTKSLDVGGEVRLRNLNDEIEGKMKIRPFANL